LVTTSTTVFPAYRDYLRGRYLASRLTSASLESAITAYEKALLLDPEFSSAWSGLATAYVLLPDYGGPPAPEVLPYAQAALDRAFATGIEMSEAFAASGFLKWLYLWDTVGAEADLQRSIELDPVNPIARYWLARVLTTMRRWREAREQVEVALAIDPLSPAAHMTLGMLLFCEGEEGAAAAFRRGLDLAPELHSAAFLLGALLALEGDVDGAASEFQRFSELTGSDPVPFEAYLSALADPALVPIAVSGLQDASFFGPTQGAALLAHLGETEASMALLETAAQTRSSYLIWANALPHFDGMRELPGFRSILAWVGF
jgi:tetratricopeptide (TPR) repeat protein